MQFYSRERVFCYPSLQSWLITILPLFINHCLKMLYIQSMLKIHTWIKIIASLSEPYLCNNTLCRLNFGVYIICQKFIHTLESLFIAVMLRGAAVLCSSCNYYLFSWLAVWAFRCHLYRLPAAMIEWKDLQLSSYFLILVVSCLSVLRTHLKHCSSSWYKNPIFPLIWYG